MKRVIVPVDLGGSPTSCAMRGPRRCADLADKVAALVECYREEREGDLWEVGFFHGGLPTRLQLEACDGLPSRLSCSPADLARGDVGWLWDAGLRTIELEVLTLKSRVLRHLRRGYSAGRARSMVEALKSMGFSIGLVLSPGLPGFRLEDCSYDIDEVLALGPNMVDFVRINPALAMAGSDSAAWVEAGRWVPLNVREAVDLCRQYVDAMEDAGIAVARVGIQPGPDLAGRVVGGPQHPNLRGIVQEERFRDRLFEALRDVPKDCCLHLRVNPKDLAWVKGAENANIRAVRAAMSIQEIRVVGDEAVPRGSLRVDPGTREGATG